MAMGEEARLLGPDVTRRDFVNATLVGAGAALIGPGCARPAAPLTDDWTGPGGGGDFAATNGNTASVMNAAHRVRDQDYAGRLAGVSAAADEEVDLVIVGGGFGGLGAMHAFAREHPTGRCVLLDNHKLFGGYAKANEFDVDGYRIASGQASFNFFLPDTAEERAQSYWPELGLPDRFRFAERTGGDPRVIVQRSASGALYYGEQSATVGYFFGDQGGEGGQWVRDIWRGDLRDAPWPADRRREMLVLRDLKRRGRPPEDEARRLDAMTFAQYAEQELQVGADSQAYVTLGMCQSGPQVSALAAMTLPGIDSYGAGTEQERAGGRFISFPDGNTTLAKLFVKTMLPAAVVGGADWESVALGAIRPLELDRSTARLRIRQEALVVRVEEEGGPGREGRVAVIYSRRGRLVRLRAKAVVMTTGAQIAKHIVAGLPPDRRAALDQHHYAPMLIANIALRNWRFLDKLGFSAARWFDGIGFYASIRQPMLVGARPTPFHPDKPIVLTMYVPFPNPGIPLEAQGAAGRMQMLETPFAEYERRIVAQLTRLFAPGGFDAARDVGGIVLNRWGHAFLTAGPGFRYGLNGGPSPSTLAVEPLGRIAWGQGADWLGTAKNGARAMEQVARFF